MRSGVVSERNLHDGAQQRLLGLGLALQLAREQLGTGSEQGAAELLTEAEDELRIAADELRGSPVASTRRS